MNSSDERIESVTGLNRRIKLLLESEIRGVWVRGEVSNLRRQSSGHSYFSLKDADSQISAVLFRGNAARQTAQLRDGLQILAYGEISVYEPRGTYQLIVRVIMDDGAGKLQAEFDRLKQKLHAEGLFAPERKVAVPAMPRTVGMITSPTGAALQDFLRILKRRNWPGRVIVLPAKVQGNGSSAEMIDMLQRAGRMGIFDLLVIGRGGGSLEDLWAFNEEPLVRAVAACKVPVISAVGHEIDFALTDFAADVRAETPSAAAELISSAFVKCDERFTFASQSLDALATRYLSDRSRRVESLGNHLRLLSPRNRVEQEHLRLDDLGNRLESNARHLFSEKKTSLNRLRERVEANSPNARIRLMRQQLETLKARMIRSSQDLVRFRKERLQQLDRRLNGLNPRAVLQRGFALVKDEEGRLVTRAAGLKPDVRLLTEFADGEISVKVEKT